MNEIPLKPCPFCGSAAVMKSRCYFAECTKCDAYGPSAGDPAASNDVRRSAAAVAWNTRALVIRDPIDVALEAVNKSAIERQRAAEDHDREHPGTPESFGGSDFP